VKICLSHSPEVSSCPISHANDKLFNENELGNTAEVCFDYPEPWKLDAAGIFFFFDYYYFCFVFKFGFGPPLLKSENLRAF
jgi:hypothetical protein